MTPEELDALVAEVEHYPGLYGGVGAQLAAAVTTLRKENKALRWALEEVELSTDHENACTLARKALSRKT